MRSITSSPSKADAGVPPLQRPPPSLRRPSPAVSAPPLSPFRPSSAVPFSWEHRPGIPKASSSSAAAAAAAAPAMCSSRSDPFLPLPPLRCRPSYSASIAPHPRRGRSPGGGSADSSSQDPFAAALAECAKEPETDMDELFRRGGAAGGRRRRTPAAWAISDRLGVMGIYGSCKATCAVSESTVRVPRSRIPSGAYDILNRPVRR